MSNDPHADRGTSPNKWKFLLRAKKGHKVFHLLDDLLEGRKLKALKTFLRSVWPISSFHCHRRINVGVFWYYLCSRQAGLFTLPPCLLLVVYKEAASDNPEQRQQPIITFIYSLFFFSTGLRYVSQTVLPLLGVQGHTFLFIYLFKLYCFKLVLSLDVFELLNSPWIRRSLLDQTWNCMLDAIQLDFFNLLETIFYPRLAANFRLLS